MWVLARTTTNLDDDPAWHGATGAAAPDEDDTFPVGVPAGAAVHGERWITIRVGWADTLGDPVATQGTCTAEPVSIDQLPMPGHSQGQTQTVASVGDPVVDVAAWRPFPLEVQPRGRWTVRLSGMAAAGAARAAVWFWASPTP